MCVRHVKVYGYKKKKEWLEKSHTSGMKANARIKRENRRGPSSKPCGTSVESLHGAGVDPLCVT